MEMKKDKTRFGSGGRVLQKLDFTKHSWEAPVNEQRKTQPDLVVVPKAPVFLLAPPEPAPPLRVKTFLQPDPARCLRFRAVPAPLWTQSDSPGCPSETVNPESGRPCVAPGGMFLPHPKLPVFTRGGFFHQQERR